MIGLDTNVLVRYLAQDDARQSSIATRFIETSLSVEKPGFVAAVTLCEIAWVLGEAYGADRRRVRDVMEKLLTTKQLVVENADLVWKALKAWDAAPADFSDALIGQIALRHGAERIVTFDKSAAKLEAFALLE